MTSGIAGTTGLDLRRLAIGTAVGGVAVAVLGYLIFDVVMASFYAANVGSATGVDRQPYLVWAVLVGACAYAALITYAIDTSGGGTSIAAGMKAGAVVGLLLWMTVDFTLYGVTNISNLTRTIVDPLLEFVRAGMAGGIIVAVIGKRSSV